MWYVSSGKIINFRISASNIPTRSSSLFPELTDQFLTFVGEYLILILNSRSGTRDPYHRAWYLLKYPTPKWRKPIFSSRILHSRLFIESRPRIPGNDSEKKWKWKMASWRNSRSSSRTSTWIYQPSKKCDGRVNASEGIIKNIVTSTTAAARRWLWFRYIRGKVRDKVIVCNHLHDRMCSIR